jgi:hypothetical protein
MDSHLVGAFHFQASAVKHVVSDHWLRCLLSYPGHIH